VGLPGNTNRDTIATIYTVHFARLFAAKQLPVPADLVDNTMKAYETMPDSLLASVIPGLAMTLAPP
jgi:hypothetical protein